MSYVWPDPRLAPFGALPGVAVSDTPPPASRNGHPPSRVTVVVPEGRELIWVSRESAVRDWEVGEIVRYRNSRWRVVSRRAEQPDALTVTLGPLEA